MKCLRCRDQLAAPEVMRRTRVVTVALVVTCAVAWGQGEGANPATELTIMPESTYLGGSVQISGATAPSQNSRTVTLTLSPPGGEDSFTRTVQLKNHPGGDDHNTFEHTEGPLEAAGTWQVEARGPVPQVPPATGQFEVTTPAAAAVLTMQSATEGLDESESFTASAQQEIANFTELPDKQQALAKTAELEELLGGFAQTTAAVSQALEQANGAMQPLAPFPEMQEAMTGLAQALHAPTQHLQSARQQLHYTHEEMNNAREWCRMFHWQKYGLKLTLNVVQFAFTASLSVKDWAVGKLQDAITSVRDKLVDQAAVEALGLTPEQVAQARKALGTMQTVKGALETYLDPNGSFGDLKKEAAFKAGDWLIDWVSAEVGGNCRMYEATVKGKFHCDYYARGVVYMVANYPWEGKIEVFFKKRERPTDIVRVEGVIRGNFGWRTGEFYPERTCADVPGMVGIGVVVPRPPYAAPWDFLLSLEGEGKPHSLTLEVTEVQYDVEWLKYGLISVLWSPYQLVPAVDFPELKVPGGHWFVTRATNTAGDEKTFEIPLTVKGDQVLMKHTFDRTMDYREQREFRAFLKMEIDGEETGI